MNMRPTVSPVRHADWRFLLPAPNGETFGHLVLLGGTPQLEATLLELGVARRVSGSVRAGDTADALVILAGADGPIDLAIEQLEAHGVLYWEVDRRMPGDLTLTPARAMRRLAEHGLTPDCAYWVKPGFPDRHMYVPVDSPGAVTWYLDTLYRAKSLPRRLFRAALRLLARCAGGIAPFAPCYAVTAVRGDVRPNPLLDAAARQGIPVNPRLAPVLVAQGDYEWNRLALLLFERGGDAPHTVIKIARRAAFNPEIEREHDCLAGLAGTLPADARHTIPSSALFHWRDHTVAVQSCVSGPNLHSRAARGRRSAAEDLQLAADWLATLHTHTSAGAAGTRGWLDARVRALVAEYEHAYPVTAAERDTLSALVTFAASDAAGRLPLVQQHADFGPWNVYRDRDTVAVIDWETARRGPALADLLYFVMQWSFEYGGCDTTETQCARLEALFCDVEPADPIVADVRALVRAYMRTLGLPAEALGPMLVYTVLEQALDRLHRLRMVDGCDAAGRDANCYTAYLDTLARHASSLFDGQAAAGDGAAVTVAIATRNRPEMLARCVDALLAGSARPDEILVIDQSDDERTASAAASAGWPALLVRYRRVSSRGLAASRNAAIAGARCPIVAFTDDDCVPDAGWLAAVQRAFGRAERPAVVTGRILPLGPDRPGYYAVSTRDSRIRALYTGRSLPWVIGSGGNTAVRREWLERVGGFDERLGAGTRGRAAEDTDLIYRLLVAGATICYEPDAIVLHERKDAEGQLRTRPEYGFGIGAFCALWARQLDPYAIWMLGRWSLERSRRLAGGCVRRQWRRVREELLMLAGAWRGVAYGLKAGQP